VLASTITVSGQRYVLMMGKSPEEVKQRKFVGFREVTGQHQKAENERIDKKTS